MQYTIFDIEANGLLEKADKLHCLSFSIFKGTQLLAKGSITEKEKIKDFILKQDCWI